MVDNISKPFTFTANTYAKASEVNADFDTLYTGVNACVNQINANIADINNLDTNKADVNGNSTQRFSVADPTVNTDAVNKQSLMKYIGNSLDYISGLIISKDSGSPDDTIIVSPGSCYDSTKNTMLVLQNNTTKQNENQGANTTYYVYIIGNSTGSLTDILISTSSTTPALPTGYTLFRKIGSYNTDSDSKIEYIYNHNSDEPDTKSTIIKTYVNGTSGYVKYSDGFIIQWGQNTTATQDAKISLLTNFTTTTYFVTLQLVNKRSGSQQNIAPYDKSTDSFYRTCNGGTEYQNPIAWIAIGY